MASLAYAAEIAEHGLGPPSSIKGASDVQLGDIQRTLGFRFPEEYRRFLTDVGEHAGEFLRGTDFSANRLLEIQTWFRNYVQERGLESPLPPTQFAFLAHQGYVFMYMDASQGEDPPVWSFGDDDPEPRKVYEKFTEWFRDTLADEAEFARASRLK